MGCFMSMWTFISPLPLVSEEPEDNEEDSGAAHKAHGPRDAEIQLEHCGSLLLTSKEVTRADLTSLNIHRRRPTEGRGPIGKVT